MSREIRRLRPRPVGRRDRVPAAIAAGLTGACLAYALLAVALRGHRELHPQVGWGDVLASPWAPVPAALLGAGAGLVALGLAALTSAEHDGARRRRLAGGIGAILAVAATAPSAALAGAVALVQDASGTGRRVDPAALAAPGLAELGSYWALVLLVAAVGGALSGIALLGGSPHHGSASSAIPPGLSEHATFVGCAGLLAFAVTLLSVGVTALVLGLRHLL